MPGEAVFADWAIDVADSVVMLGATQHIPTFTPGCQKLHPANVEATQKLANIMLCTNVSRSFLQQKELISQKSSKGVILDSVVRVCCASNNVLEGIVPLTKNVFNTCT